MTAHDPVAEAELEVRRRLHELTGFEHAVFVQSGTAALEAVLSVVTSPRARVALPALGCWTVSFAITKLGRTPVFCDVGEHWSAEVAVAADATILVDPWNGPSDWRTFGDDDAVRIVDLTLAPGALLDGAPAGAWSDAAVASLGGGKTLSCGGGGVALFHDREVAREASRLLRFGFADGAWRDRVDRYGFSRYLFPVLAARLRMLPDHETAGALASGARAILNDAGLASNVLRDGGTWGRASGPLPVCLPPGYPLSVHDIEGVAISSAIPLTRHPVTPPYRQRAWGDRAASVCPRAEELASRLLFFAPEELSLANVSDVVAFLKTLSAAPERFRTPFPLPRPARNGVLPPDLAALARTARLVRNLDLFYGLFEEDVSLMWPLTDDEAAQVQALQEQERAGRTRSARSAPPRSRGFAVEESASLHPTQGT